MKNDGHCLSSRKKGCRCSHCTSKCCKCPERIPGPSGPRGRRGETGATGTVFTDVSGYAANTSGETIAVVLGGTPVSLPDAQDLGKGIIINATNTILTVATAGRYYIEYNIQLTAALLLGSRLLINGTVNIPSTLAPALSVSGFRNSVIVTLTAGSTIELQLFGLLGAAVLEGNGTGANLTIIKLSN